MFEPNFFLFCQVKSTRTTAGSGVENARAVQPIITFGRRDAVAPPCPLTAWPMAFPAEHSQWHTPKPGMHGELITGSDNP